VAAVVTPPDVVSQLLLAIPMCLLYEFGILLAQVIERFFRNSTAKGAGTSDPAEGRVAELAGPSEPVEIEPKRLE
jgi:sec-independent protein translocase protein TatC